MSAPEIRAPHNGKIHGKDKICSEENAFLLRAATPPEMEALSLFELGLSWWQFCLRGVGRANC
jgi:hypothetical protein